MDKKVIVYNNIITNHNISINKFLNNKNKYIYTFINE